MEHRVKIVIGANYGDEGKGLMSRYFTKGFLDSGSTPVTVLHNGTAQRGHTADYEDGTRHVFHNFGAGAKDGGATYYADTFLVHPMDFCREFVELGFMPLVYCDPDCVVVTPFDMLADHVIEDFIAAKSGCREYGSCGYGSWSATDRIRERPDLAYRVWDFMDERAGYIIKMRSLFGWAQDRIRKFGVELDAIPHWKKHFVPESALFFSTCSHFRNDMAFFLASVHLCTFSHIWGMFPSIIFEGAQGLLLDRDMPGGWTTTSKTGLENPHRLLRKYAGFDAEVCYVTRSYVTRHGDGPLVGETVRNGIGESQDDRTNTYNMFQGALRYAKLDRAKLEAAIQKDFSLADSMKYHRSLAITHCGAGGMGGGDYRSYTPHEVIKVTR